MANWTDLTIPLVVAAPCALALCGAIGALWRERIAERAAWAKERDELEDRWALEVRRGARLAATPSDGKPPASLPPPDWKEAPRVRQLRSFIEQDEIKRLLQAYVRGDSEETTPQEVPRPRR